MIVAKRNNELRIYGDFRPINPILEDFEFLIPKINELISSVETPINYIARLDLANAFHQIRIEKEMQKYATIRTHLGGFRYK